MIIAMSVSVKCNEQILGSISLDSQKTTIIEIKSFPASIGANSHGTILVHGPDEKKYAKNGTIREDFLAICLKHTAFPTMFVFIFYAVFPGALLRCVNFETSLSC